MPHVHASIPGAHESAAGNTGWPELAVEIDWHRNLLRAAVEAYRRRVALRVHHLDRADRDMRLVQAEQHIAALMIDPVRDHDLDIDAYRAIREGQPVQFDPEQRTFVLHRPGRPPLPIRPGTPEHRLGVIARLAGLGLSLEQIQVVAITTAQTVAPHEAAVPSLRAPVSVRRHRRHTQQPT